MNNNFMGRVNKIVQEDKARMNRASPPLPPYPDAGIGALENVSTGAPRQTMIANQPHMLAYINPQEEQMLRNAGGAGMPGPDGIPAYWFHGGWGGGGGGSTTTSEPDNDPQPSVWDNIKTTVSNIGTGIKNTFTGGGSDDSGSGGYIGDLVSGGGSDNKGNLGVLGDIGGAIGDAVGVTSYYDDPENDATGTGVATGTDTKTATNTVTYTDSKGGTHSTQAAADAQNILIADEANRVTADANGITIKKTGVFGTPTYVDDSGESYSTPEEAIAANTALVTGKTVSAGTDVGTDVGTVDTAGALPSGSNNITQFFANLLTPFDNKSYVGGNLIYDNAGDFTEDPTAATNESGFVDPLAGEGSELLVSAYAKIAAGNAADLTEDEQRALYGQRGQVPNAAETLALTENYKASGEITMTQDMQDEIVKAMNSSGATKEQIDT